MLIRYLLIIVILICTGAASSRAAPLKPTLCGDVYQKHSNLDLDNIFDWLSRGPDWAKENLSSEQLDEIKTYISTEEVLKFRCVEFVPPPVQNPMPRSARGVIKNNKDNKANKRLSTHNVPLPPRKPI